MTGQTHMLTAAIRKIVPSYGYTLPDPEWLWRVYEATKFTPDIARLEEYEWQLIFVADGLKKDHVHHHRLGERLPRMIPAFTQKNFHFWQPQAPFIDPVPLEVPEGYTNMMPFFPPVAKIKGEVYAIRPQTFMDLDRMNQNGVEFFRRRIRLVVPYRKVVFLRDHNLDPSFGVQELLSRSEYTGSSIKTSEELTCILRAWMYIGKPEFWDPMISAYDWGPVEHYNSNKRRWAETYYHIRRPPLPTK
jgi:hypothetical protein